MGARPALLSLLAGGLLLGCLSVGAKKQIEVQVIHFNDNHARFDPADVNFGALCDGEQADVCFGGFARQATAIQQAKAAADQRNVDTLVFHAGDQYTGTLWDVVYTSQGIQVAPQFLQQLGVQAFTLGNHEFDHGPSNLAGFIANVSGAFPVLSCNLDTSREPALDGLVQRYALIRLPRSNATVGVVGLTSVETPQTSNPGPTVGFLPYRDTLPGCVADARAEGADFIIALTHIGFGDDVALAADPAAADVDLVVGGHSHTLLYGEPAPANEEQVASTPPPILVSPPTNESSVPLGPYPTLAVQNGNKSIPVVQALYASRYLGVLNTSWDLDEGLVSANGTPVLLGGANSTNPVADDPAIAQQLQVLRGPIDDYSNSIVGTSDVFLDGERATIRNQETNLGDMACQAVYEFAADNTGLLHDNPNLPPVCLLNAGIIRASIQAGNVTQGDVTTVSPFGNWFVAKKINASTLIAALNSGLSGWTGDGTAPGRFPQVGGLRYAFDPARIAGSRLVNAVVLGSNGSATPLESFKGDMILLTNNYVADGGDYYTMFAGIPILLDSSMPISDLLALYFENNSPVDATTDGRIANCQQEPSNMLCADAGDIPATDAPPPSSAAQRRACPASSTGRLGVLAMLGLLLVAACLL